MNQVAPNDPRRNVAQPSRSSESERSAKMIAQIDEHCLAPVRAADELFARHREGFSIALGLRAETFPSSKIIFETVRGEAELLRVDAGLMSAEDAERYTRTMHDAWSTKPSRSRSGLCIARLIDSFPNARPHNPTTYRENLVHLCEVDGHSPVVVAMACDAVMRDPAHTFLPAPAAFLDECRKVFNGLQRNHRYGWMILQARHLVDTRKAEVAAIWAEAAPVLPPAPDPALEPPPLPPNGRGFV